MTRLSNPPITDTLPLTQLPPSVSLRTVSKSLSHISFCSLSLCLCVYLWLCLSVGLCTFVHTDIVLVVVAVYEVHWSQTLRGLIPSLTTLLVYSHHRFHTSLISPHLSLWLSVCVSLCVCLSLCVSLCLSVYMYMEQFTIGHYLLTISADI